MVVLFLEDGKLNIITRNKQDSISIVLQDSSHKKHGDVNIIKLVIDGENNRLLMNGEEIPLFTPSDDNAPQ